MCLYVCALCIYAFIFVYVSSLHIANAGKLPEIAYVGHKRMVWRSFATFAKCIHIHRMVWHLIKSSHAVISWGSTLFVHFWMIKLSYFRYLMLFHLAQIGTIISFRFDILLSWAECAGFVCSSPYDLPYKWSSSSSSSIVSSCLYLTIVLYFLRKKTGYEQTNRKKMKREKKISFQKDAAKLSFVFISTTDETEIKNIHMKK